MRCVLALLLVALAWPQASGAQACDPESLIAPPEKRIVSQQEWDAHVANIARNGSPLAALPAFARKQFVRRVRFNERGFIDLNPDLLEQELTLSQAYRVLALLGAEPYAAFLDNIRIDTEMDRQLRACLDAAK